MGTLKGIAVLVLMLAACSTGSALSHEVRVVASTSILGDILVNLVDGGVTVEVLIPPGIDPHDFQPSAAQLAGVEGADLVVVNGLGLEGRLIDTLQSTGAPIIELAPGLDPLPLPQGGLDPHVWQDPVRMIEGIERLAGALESVGVASNWKAYAEQIRHAHSLATDRLAAVPEDQRRLVTNHDAFGYFADRYGFEVVGVVIPGGDTLAQPSARETTELVEAISRQGVRAIFVEQIASVVVAEAVAAEFGDRVGMVALYSDSLGPPGSGADTYLGMIDTNARLVADALGTR